MKISDISDEQLKETIQEGLVMVDYWAPWCGPCKALAPKLEEIASDASMNTKIVKINIDENQVSALQYAVRGIPTLILFRDGKEVGRLAGNQPKESIQNLILSAKDK